MKATAVIMFLSSLIRDDGDFDVPHKMQQSCAHLAEINDCATDALLGLLKGEDLADEDEDEDTTLENKLRDVQVGDYLKANHPQTCINPDTYFRVEYLKEENGSIYARGRNTCWFNVEQCKLPEEEGVTIIEAGFDTTSFPSSEVFINLCKKFDLGYEGLAGPMIMTENNNCFGFCGPKISVYTTNNPITGEYFAGKNRRENQKGFAGYIGVQGQKPEVKAFCNLVKKMAEYYKDFDPNNRSFI